MTFEGTLVDLLGRGVAVRFRARGDSMYPTFRCGEKLHVEPVGAAEISRGDVVLARHQRGLTAHRVIRIDRENGRVVQITTRGDNCRRDDAPFSPDDLLGKVRESFGVRTRRLLRASVCAALVLGGAAAQSATIPPLTGVGASGTVLASPAGFGVVRPLTLGEISDAQIRQQRDLAADAGLKIYVTEEGWQRVTKSAMLAAGYDPGNDGGKLSLFCAGIEQPISVDDGGNGKFDAPDAVGFYGLPLDTRSTGARTYWLRTKGGNNRVKLAKGKGGSPATGSVPFTAQRIDRNIFAAAVKNVEENFFGPLIFAGEQTSQDITVAGIDSSYAGNATLEVTL